ncbi:MAG: hypothetical protein IMF14_01805 [Proteobacteria bacterium]|nr:hypothetical protein [Pseudomonadota bacterium]
MNEDTNIQHNEKDASKSNLLVAGILTLIALCVASMPFFYITDQIV